MKKIESNNTYNNRKLQPGDVNDPKVLRSEKEKLWICRLSQVDIDYINDKIENSLSKFFNY